MSAMTRVLAVVVAGTVSSWAMGCATKQIRDEGSLQSGQSQATVGASSPADSKSSVGSAPLSASNPATTNVSPAASASKPVPPAASGALPEKALAVQGRGLGGETTSGLDRIHFGFDQATLTEEARDTLTRDARYLRAARSGAKVRIEGHCDERGTAEYNLALGEKRALAARQYLVDVGVEKERLSVISYGKESPLDPAHTESAWAANRRAEVVEVRP